MLSYVSVVYQSFPITNSGMAGMPSAKFEFDSGAKAIVKLLELIEVIFDSFFLKLYGKNE
jgi:hypothetical protein